MIKHLGVKAQKFSSHFLHPTKQQQHNSSTTTGDHQENKQEQLQHRTIGEDCLDGQSRVNNDELALAVDLIDGDIDVDDEKEIGLLQSAMYYALMTLHLPIHMIPEERDSIPLSLSQLQNEVLKLFESKLTIQELENTWNDLYVNRSNNGSIDLIVDFLLMRRFIFESEHNLPYTPNDFISPTAYNAWRRNKMKEIDLMLDSIKTARKSEFNCKLEFEINEMNILHSPHLNKKHECDLLYHLDTTDPDSSIKINNDTKTKVMVESKPHPTKKQNESFKPIFKDVIKLSLLKRDQNVNFSIVLSKYAGLKKKEIGHVSISVANLVDKLFPKSNWGNIESSEQQLVDYPILLSTKVNTTTTNHHGNDHHGEETVIGNLQIKISKGNYQYFPAHQNNWTNYVAKRLDYIKNNLNTIDIPNIYKIKSVLLRRSFMVPKNDTHFNLVTPVHKWVLGEIDLLFGLSTHNAEISLLDVLSRNVRFLISFGDQFSKSYQTATKMVNDNLKQTEKINEIMEKTEKKVIDILMHFKDRFPRNKPDGALENVVKLYDTIICAHKKHSFEQYLDILRDVIKKSLENDYNLIVQQQLEVFKTEELSAKVLIGMIPGLTYKLDHLYDFSNAFPEDIKYEEMNMIYYELFKRDFEKVSQSGGFNGYQMLHFCSKLKDLTEVIENSNDLSSLVKKHDQSAVHQLINIEEVSKGYEEMFIAELYNKLSDCADQSIKIDNWIQVNQEVKHSTSVVDFYTSANEIWNYVSDLEFFSDHLLQMFTEMLAKVTLEYANKVKNIAVQTLTKNAREKSSLVVQEKTKSIRLFNNKKQQNSSSEQQADFTYSEVELTADFLVMLNDISVSKQELEEILDSIVEKHRDLKDSEEISKQLSGEGNKEEDLDLENEQDLKNSSDNYDDNHQMSTLQKFRTSIDLIIESLIAIISSSFKIPMRITLQNIVNKTRVLIDQSNTTTTNNTTTTTQQSPLSKEDTLKIIQTEIDSILSNELLDSVLTPAFTILSENCYDQIFKLLLENILDIMNSEMINSFIVPTENYDVELDKDKFLTIEQLFALESVHTTMGIYLCGNDDDPETGLPEELVESKSRLLAKLISMYQSTTPKLISIYQKYIKYPNLNFSNILKKHHILLLLKAKKGDLEATQFYKLHQKEAEKQRLIQVFNLKPVEGANDDDESNDKYEELLLTVNGITYEMSPYDIHVTELRLLLESKCSRKTKEFLLKSIVDAKFIKHLLSTNSTVQFSIRDENDNNEKRVYSVIFKDSELRTKFLNVFSQQLKNIGNEQTQLCELKSPQTASGSLQSTTSSSNNSSLHNIFDQTSDALKSKFKIKNSNCKLVKRMIAQACYKTDSTTTTTGTTKVFISGEVLLFNYGICFHCGSDGVKGTFSLKFNFSIVKQIEGKKRRDDSMRIKITLQGGYSISFYNLEFYENCLSDLLNSFEEWKKDSSLVQATSSFNQKTVDDKNYFISKFNLKNIGEKDESLDRKLTCGSSLTESGSLFIGNYHICYESDSYLPNNGDEKTKEQIILPVAFIEKLEKYVHSKLLAIRLLSGHIVCFMFQDEKSLEAAYQRINVKVQSISKPKISIFGSSNNNSNTENNLYVSSILKSQPIDTDSCDQRMLNNAIITKQIQEAPLQQQSIIGRGVKEASQNSSSGSGGGVFHYFNNIGKIFGSKKNKQ